MRTGYVRPEIHQTHSSLQDSVRVHRVRTGLLRVRFVRRDYSFLCENIKWSSWLIERTPRIQRRNFFFRGGIFSGGLDITKRDEVWVLTRDGRRRQGTSTRVGSKKVNWGDMSVSTTGKMAGRLILHAEKTQG